MKKSVLVRIIAAAMAIALCVCSVGALTGCTQTRKINVLVYGQYIDLDVISNFKKEHGIKVNVDECDTPEELYNKAVNGDQSYDLICTSDYIIERFIKENRLAELNFDNIPNIKNIGEVYLEKSKSFDPENKYSVPHFWGTVGVIYNTKMVSEEDAKSWKMFFNEKYSGKIIMSNSIRDSFLVALEALGYSLNTTDKAQIDEAKQLLIKQKPMPRRRTSNISIIRPRIRRYLIRLLPRFSRMRTSSRPARLSIRARSITISARSSMHITAQRGKK